MRGIFGTRLALFDSLRLESEGSKYSTVRHPQQYFDTPVSPPTTFLSRSPPGRCPLIECKI